MTTPQYIAEAFEKQSVFNFTENQMTELAEIIEQREIAKLYNEAYITYYEGVNMIMDHAAEIASKSPNKGAFPKPPKYNYRDE